MITAASVRELLYVNHHEGRAWWKHRKMKWFLMFIKDRGKAFAEYQRWNARYMHAEAFTHTDGGGYKQGRFLNVRVRAHRIFYLHFHGVMPMLVDHKNGVRTDNRIYNLKNATYQENAQNRPEDRAKREAEYKKWQDELDKEDF